MSDNTNDANGNKSDTNEDTGPDTDTGAGQAAERETPEVGLIADEELPEDLQPTDDNPLAKDPSETDDSQEGDSSDGAGPSGEKKVEGMPDMGEPGAPA